MASSFTFAAWKKQILLPGSQFFWRHRKFVCHFVRVGNLMLFLLVVVAVVLFEADDNKNNNIHIYIYFFFPSRKMIQNCTIWLEVSLAVWSGYVQVCTVNSLFRHYPSKLSFETTCCYNMLVDIALQVHLRLISTKKTFIWPPKQLANNPFSTHWNQLELSWNSTFQHFHPTRPPLFHWNVESHVFPWLGHAWQCWYWVTLTQRWQSGKTWSDPNKIEQDILCDGTHTKVPALQT